MENLPEHVLISCILSKIDDAKSLAFLSTLNRSFNRMASMAPSLNLEFPVSWRPESPSRSMIASEIAVAEISRRKQGSIKHLRIGFCPSEFILMCMSEESISKCIHLVSSSIEEIRLKNRGCSYSDLLPRLSRCSKLAQISIESGYFDGIPRENMPFLKLARCRFTSVIFRGNDLENFVAKCPALEELRLDRCFSTDNAVNILQSGSLIRLAIVECNFRKMEIRMNNLARLELEQIRGNVLVSGGKILELRIDSICAKYEYCFAGGGLSQLAFLTVNGRGWTSRAFLGLLNLAPNLRQLKIMKLFSTKDEVPGLEEIKQSMMK